MKRINKLTLLLTITAGLLATGCKRDPEQTGIQYPFDDMAQPVPYEAFSENPNMPDGKTMQLKVKGTIARGHMPYTLGKFAGLAEAEKLRNPYAKTEKTLERGKYLFNNFCIQCHGQFGKGDGSITKKFAEYGIQAFNSEGYKVMSEGKIFHTATKGFATMPAHENQLSVEDRWNITQYVQELQKLK